MVSCMTNFRFGIWDHNSFTKTNLNIMSSTYRKWGTFTNLSVMNFGNVSEALARETPMDGANGKLNERDMLSTSRQW